MPLFPFFVRDGCRSSSEHRALRMLPFPEQGKRSLILLGTGSTAACGFQQQSRCAVPLNARSTSAAPFDFSLTSGAGVSCREDLSAAPLPCGAELLFV